MTVGRKLSCGKTRSLLIRYAFDFIHVDVPLPLTTPPLSRQGVLLCRARGGASGLDHPHGGYKSVRPGDERPCC